MPATLDFFPVALPLNDGRTLFVELPAKMIRQEGDGSIGYTLDGVRHLDKLRALAMRLEDRPTPGHIAALREGLGLTQAQLGAKLHVDKLTVSRWERGQVSPGLTSIRRLRALRDAVAKRGVVVG